MAGTNTTEKPVTELVPKTSTTYLEGTAAVIYNKTSGDADAFDGDTLKDILDNAVADHSGKAEKSEMSVVPGTGSDADKTTITLKQGASATVLTQHQDISGKANKPTAHTEDDLASLDSEGNLKDSGKKPSDFVEKEAGKGLSSNDYTDTEKTKLGALPTNADLQTALGNKEDKSNKVTSFSNPTDTQYPSAKLVSDSLDKVKADVSSLLTKAGIAEGIADTISAGTAQEFLQRQSGGDGVNCLKRIKGKTRAWRQLFANKATPTFAISEGASYPEVAAPTESYEIISGHKYLVLAKITLTSGTMPTTLYMTWRQTGDYQITPNVPRVLTALTDTTISANSGVLRVLSGSTPAAAGTCLAITADLTMFYGSEIDGMTDAQVLAKYMQEYGQFYYAPASVLKSNDAAALLTNGRNQWDEVWEPGAYDVTTGNKTPTSNRVRSVNKIEVFEGRIYHIEKGAAEGVVVLFYDANGSYLAYRSNADLAAASYSFTTPSSAAFCAFYISASTYNNDICINLSDASFDGTYEPYWQRVLALRLSELTGIPEGGTEADRVTIFPNGLGGAGSAYDSIAEGKGNKRRARVNLGGLEWGYVAGGTTPYFQASANTLGIAPCGPANVANVICQKYTPRAATLDSGNAIGIGAFNSGANSFIRVIDSAYTDAATFTAAMDGVYLEYELATPIVYTDIQYADGTPFTMPATILVDIGGVERVISPTHADGSPSAPFRCDSTYSISIARLVKVINQL